MIEPLLTAAVGVPEITPVAAASDNPAGSVPPVIAQLTGGVPPLADSVALYRAPTCPAGSALVETVNGAVAPEPPLPEHAPSSHPAAPGNSNKTANLLRRLVIILEYLCATGRADYWPPQSLTLLLFAGRQNRNCRLCT